MPKVLLVEDDNNLREIFEMRLQADGYQTVTAADGEEGLTVAVKEKPDLIISDVMMPKLSGFEMIENLKSAPEMQNTKVIMMTALGQAEDKVRGEKLGVVKYLVKSQVTLEDFARVVNEVLGQKPAGNAAPESQATVNKQESENSMEDSNNTATPPADPAAPADGGTAPGVNPISGTPTDGSAGSEQQTTAQEQSTVQDQINNFAAGTPTSDAPAAPGGDTPAPADPAAPAATDGTYTPPATPPADPAAPADASAPAAPGGDAPTDGATPAAPSDPGASSI